MSHNIGEMFYFGAIPWHGLGKELGAPATMEQGLAAGGLNWNVALVPLMTDEVKPSPVPPARQR
jgi:hypothetical protein